MTKIVFVMIFCALCYFFYLFLHPYLTERYCRRLLAVPKNYDNDLLHKLLRASYSNSRIFRSLSLPIPGKEGEEIRVGTVVVNRLGVYIICQIHGGGLIDNQPRANWRHMIGGKCAEFQNPFGAQEDARSLISFYARNLGFGEVKVRSLVVFTDSSLKFTQGQNRAILSAVNLNKKLQMYNKMGKLKLGQVRMICKMLSDLDEGICA